MGKTVFYVSCDGTGVPGIKRELEGKNGRQSDGSAKTFEAKIGVCFNQDFDSNGDPLLRKGEIFRRDGSSKYVGTVENAVKFGPMLHDLAASNGIQYTDQVVFLGDGTTWIWNLQQRYFPNAIGIVDKYHAIENLNKIVSKLRFNKGEIREAFRVKCKELLSYGKIEELDALIMGKTTIKSKTKMGKSSNTSVKIRNE